MSDALLTLQHVSAGYASQPVFADLDLRLTPGQFAALVGPTGGGKSTLLKLILGLLPCTRGSVHRLPQMTMGYVPQREIIDWRFPVTAEQVVRRITATANGAARSPSNLVGAGSVDPVAALTWDVPEGARVATVKQVAAPPPPSHDDPTPRTVAFVGAGALALVALATAAFSAQRRKDTAS